MNERPEKDGLILFCFEPNTPEFHYYTVRDNKEIINNTPIKEKPIANFVLTLISFFIIVYSPFLLSVICSKIFKSSLGLNLFLINGSSKFTSP